MQQQTDIKPGYYGEEILEGFVPVKPGCKIDNQPELPERFNIILGPDEYRIKLFLFLGKKPACSDKSAKTHPLPPVDKDENRNDFYPTD